MFLRESTNVITNLNIYDCFGVTRETERKQSKITKISVSSEPYSHLPVYFEYFIFELNLNIIWSEEETDSRASYVVNTHVRNSEWNWWWPILILFFKVAIYKDSYNKNKKNKTE